MNAGILQFYASPSDYTLIENKLNIFRDIPSDPKALFNVAKSIIVHPQRSGMEETENNIQLQMNKEKNTRSVNDILIDILSVNDNCISFSKNIFSSSKSVYSCPYISLLLCSIFRSKSIPARIRVGFKRATNSTDIYMHWVVEAFINTTNTWNIIDADESDDFHDSDGFIKSIDFISSLKNKDDIEGSIAILVYDLFCLFKDELSLKISTMNTVRNISNQIIYSNSLLQDIIQSIKEVDTDIFKLEKIYNKLKMMA